MLIHNHGGRIKHINYYYVAMFTTFSFALDLAIRSRHFLLYDLLITDSTK